MMSKRRFDPVSGFLQKRVTSICLISGLACLLQAQAAVSVALDGKIKMPVIVSSSASKEVKHSAETLAAYLGRITGDKFEVKFGDGSTGLAVGVDGDFHIADLRPSWDVNDPLQGDEYLLKSHPGGVYILGVNHVATEHAVWDLLYRLGYRQYFPGADWEIVPRSKSLTVMVDTKESPSYKVRQPFYSFGTWPEGSKAFVDWAAKNRVNSSFRLNTGHSYEDIIARHKDDFAAHPEMLAVEQGKRTSKLVVSNPRLVDLVVQDAMGQIARNPNLNTISLEPSDGGGWGDDPQFQRPSDRVVTLANAVADALRARYGNRYLVSFYAYNLHSLPPTLHVHPGIIVNVATAYNTSGMSGEDLVRAWRDAGAIVGIREYYSLIMWDMDLPRAARASSPAYFLRTIPGFYDRGARFMTAESSANWGACGLGYFLISRLLWDVRETSKVDSLRTEFFVKCFGPAEGPMRRFYDLTEGKFAGSNRVTPVITNGLLSSMYKDLSDAAELASGDPKIMARIDDLTAYVRYCELMHKFLVAPKGGRQAEFEDVIKYAYSIKNRDMVHSMAIYRALSGIYKDVSVPKEASWDVPEGTNPWKASPPVSAEDLRNFRSGSSVASSDVSLLAKLQVQLLISLNLVRVLRLRATGEA